MVIVVLNHVICSCAIWEKRSRECIRFNLKELKESNLVVSIFDEDGG